MSKDVKFIRGQVRQIVKEELPVVMSAELKSALYAEIKAAVTHQLTQISQQVSESLKGMEERQKDIQNFIMRQVAQMAANPPNAETQTLPLDAKDE